MGRLNSGPVATASVPDQNVSDQNVQKGNHDKRGDDCRENGPGSGVGAIGDDVHDVERRRKSEDPADLPTRRHPNTGELMNGLLQAVRICCSYWKSPNPMLMNTLNSCLSGVSPINRRPHVT